MPLHPRPSDSPQALPGRWCPLVTKDTQPPVTRRRYTDAEPEASVVFHVLAETGSGTWHPDVGIGPSPACAGAPAGETRYKAALSLGLTLAPVVTIPARQARAFRVIDNRTSELTSWDTDLLPDALSGLNDLDIFSFDDILPLAVTAGKTNPDDIPETPKNPVSRVGDI